MSQWEKIMRKSVKESWGYVIKGTAMWPIQRKAKRYHILANAPNLMMILRSNLNLPPIRPNHNSMKSHPNKNKIPQANALNISLAKCSAEEKFLAPKKIEIPFKWSFACILLSIYYLSFIFKLSINNWTKILEEFQFKKRIKQRIALKSWKEGIICFF